MEVEEKYKMFNNYTLKIQKGEIKLWKTKRRNFLKEKVFGW